MRRIRMMYDLNMALLRAAHDDSIRVIILARSGRHYSTGDDLKDLEHGAIVAERQRTGPDIPVLQQFLAGMGLARQKAPERIERVGDLPRTASGKVRKDMLRSRVASTITEETQQKAEDSQDA